MSDSALWEGKLACPNDHDFPVRRGIPHLYIDDDAWQPKKLEAEGWVKLHKRKGIYEPGDDPVDLRIPYVDEAPWPPIAQAFDLALDRLNIKEDAVVLDLGAGRGWAAKQFAQRGGRVIALDIVADEKIGLGRAYALMQQAGVTFDLIIGDGEKLPLLPGSIDIVFCCGTLHHATNLPLFIQNIAQALKPAGLLCAINEPCLSIWRSEQRVLGNTAQEELAVGINETIPTFPDYTAALAANDLHIEQAFPSDHYDPAGVDWQKTAHRLGALWGGLSIQAPLDSLKGVAAYLYRRLMAVGRAPLTTPAYSHVRDNETLVQAAILTWCGGELFFLARKGGRKGGRADCGDGGGLGTARHFRIGHQGNVVVGNRVAEVISNAERITPRLFSWLAVTNSKLQGGS